jgi:hypothetical protein
MAKYINDSAMDACLNWIKTSASKCIVCSAQPATAAEATGTYDLSTTAITSANITGPTDGASGRKITIDEIVETAIQHSGDATYVALTSTPTTTYVGTVAPTVQDNYATDLTSDTVSVSPPLPAGVEAGDTIIVTSWSTSNTGTGCDTACDTGYTMEIKDYLATTQAHMCVFSKIAGESEADPIVTQTSTNTADSITIYARVWVFRNSGTDLGVTCGTRAEINDTAVTFPGITTASDNVMVLAISVVSAYVNHTGGLSNANVTFTEAGAADSPCHLHYGIMDTAGAIGDTTGTVDHSQYGMYCHVGLDLSDDVLTFATTCPTTTLDSAVKLTLGAWDIQISDPV